MLVDPLDEGRDVHRQQARDALQPTGQMAGGHRLDDAAAGITLLQSVEKLPADRLLQVPQGELVGEQTGGCSPGPLLGVAGRAHPLLTVPLLGVRAAESGVHPLVEAAPDDAGRPCLQRLGTSVRGLLG